MTFFFSSHPTGYLGILQQYGASSSRQFGWAYWKNKQLNPYEIASCLGAEVIILKKNNMWTRAIHYFGHQMTILDPYFTCKCIGSLFGGVNPRGNCVKIAGLPRSPANLNKL